MMIVYQTSVFRRFKTSLTWNLTGSGGSNFSFVVAEQFRESLDEFLPYDILSHSRRQLIPATSASIQIRPE